MVSGPQHVVWVDREPIRDFVGCCFCGASVAVLSGNRGVTRCVQAKTEDWGIVFREVIAMGLKIVMSTDNWLPEWCGV